VPIFKEKNIIQIRIPKTGSSSINTALSDGGSFGYKDMGPNRIHSSAAELMSFLGKDAFDSYFKFTFVRNPFDWFVSRTLYWGKTLGSAYSSNIGVSIEEWMLGLGRVMDSRDGDYFNYNPYFPTSNPVSCGHKRCPARYGERECGCVTIDQSFYVCGRERRLLADFVGKFESLDDDWRLFSEKAGIKHVELKLRNKQGHSKKSYASMFEDKRVVDIVYQIFKKDCELFGYSVDNYDF
jgi:hypothetical protein